MPDLRQPIKSALASFAKRPIRDASYELFTELGYRSERTLDFGSVGHFCSEYDKNGLLTAFQPASNWQNISLVFQLTGEDIKKGSSKQLSLLEPDPADLSKRQIQSYLFIAIELKAPADNKLRTRTDLCEIARAINRLFPMPALILFKEQDFLSIAITYRRTNKKDSSKDIVSRKVTLIKDIRYAAPHPGHLAILEDFALPTLSEFRGRDIKTFADLDTAWNESLSVELLRRRAYRMLADWYFWARQHAEFPPDATPDADGKPSLHLIRLLTRVIFCWFVKEKTLPDGKPLIPYDLFDPPRIREILKDASPKAHTYYTAILQNLFFATLNTEMDGEGNPEHRRFARKVKEDHMVHTLWRHDEQLRNPTAFADLVRSVPFLNGGLFECLDDRVEIDGTNQTREVRVDGFSTNPAKHPRIPNFLFFGEDQHADLSEETGSKRSDVEVVPLLSILNRFVWTITESTPLEEEVALDPDLLGNVFENLLASYNPETGTVARNATGSFYTPDYVVDWMIDKALIPLLVKAMPPKTRNAETRVRRLLDWNDPGHDFKETEITALIECISKLRALDPACGSGAFPMGLLKKLVRVLTKLDPGNILWEKKQTDLAEQLDSAPAREQALAAITRAFSHDQDDYGRKLYLIDNGIYGVDIQPLAVQIAKLRFFITLIVDQPIEADLPNYGILPLPNLETKIVPANTLLGLQRGQLMLGSNEVRQLERELKTVRHSYFTARRYQDKKALRKRDREICKQLAKALVDSGECTPADARRLVDWNPYNTNTHAGFFDPGWMFGLEGEGGKFDLVIGNPPYVRQEALKSVMVQDSVGKQRPLKDVLKDQYQCFTGTADLYVYFFEKSIELLRVGGVLSFITSNKYFRAAYGEKLRAYLLYATAPQVILDFADTNIFTAVAYPCIIVTEKVRNVEDLPDSKLFEHQSSFDQLVSHADRDFPVMVWQPGPSKIEFPEIFEQEHVVLSQKELKPTGWRLEAPVGLRLLERLRKGGTPLGEYCNGRFYRGILTGYNEAFVVNRETRDILTKEHNSSEAILKPFLRGRDVKRWRCEYAEHYLIKIESSENVQHPWSGLPLPAAEAVFKKSYPAIHAYFELGDNRAKLIKRSDQGKYFWELRSCAYWQEFEKPKIIVPAIQESVQFAPDTNQYFGNNKLTIFVPPSLHFALACTNSKVAQWIATQTFASKQGGFFDFEPRYSSTLPIPPATDDQKQLCESLSAALIHLHNPEAAALHNRSLMVAYFEQWLNGLVYELFFPGELHARNLHIFDLTTTLGLPTDPAAADYPEQLQAAFHRAHDLNKPLRGMLADLQTIEEVRIIEGEK
jgi:adenine-specific DNA-methyltransferase